MMTSAMRPGLTGSSSRRMRGETYVYDQDGNLTDVKNAAEQSKFWYDGNGNLSGMVSPDGTDFSYTYDSRNNLTEAKNSDGAV